MLLFRTPISLLLGCLLLPTAGLCASNATLGDMMRGMATGLALLGQAANNNPAYNPYVGSWPGGAPAAPWGAPPWAYPQGPQPPYPNARQQLSARLLELLQGSWETDAGGLWIVNGQRARLYLTQDRYQDMLLDLDSHYLWMRPAGSQQALRYEHRIFDKRIILRDDSGRILQLRRYPVEDSRY